MIKHEASFQTEFSRGWKLFTSTFEKIPDVGMMKKRYDCWALYKGVFYAMELKSHRICGSFNLAKIEDHQYFYLENDKRNGAKAFVIIEVEFTATDKQMKKYGLTATKNKFIVYDDVSFFSNKVENGEKSICMEELLTMKRLVFIKDTTKSYKPVCVDIRPLIETEN